MKTVLCPACNKIKPHCALGYCKNCYSRVIDKKRRDARARQVKAGLGKCFCGETAVTRIRLKYGNGGLSAANGEYFNLCAACAELEAKQEAMR